MKKILKGFFAALITAIIVTSSTSATKLYPGEKIVDGKIVGNTIISPADGEMQLFWNKESDCPNFCSSKETMQFWYTGYIQFQPAYRTQEGDPCGLKPNRNVKQAWLDYRRKMKDSNLTESVCDGPHYTKEAHSIYETDYYFKKISAHDSIISGDDNRTYFYRGWFYFAE